MTPALHSPPASAAASSQPPLQFVRGDDGRWRAGVYVLSPGRVGFDIQVVDVFREGVHVHRPAGKLALENAIDWARDDAARLGNVNMGQRALL
jgi:hypothetical protein